MMSVIAEAALSHLIQGRVRAAIDELDKSPQADADWQSQLVLAQAWAAEGNLKQAQGHAVNVFRRCPILEEIGGSVGSLLVRVGRPDLAVAAYDATLRRAGRTESDFAAAAAWFGSIDEWERATVCLQRALAIGRPESRRCLMLRLSEVLWRRGRFLEAALRLREGSDEQADAGPTNPSVVSNERTTDSMPIDPTAALALAVSHLRRMATLDAEAVLNTALAQGGDHPDLLLCRAIGRSMRGQWPDSIADLETAASLAPGDNNIFTQLALDWCQADAVQLMRRLEGGSDLAPVVADFLTKHGVDLDRAEIFTSYLCDAGLFDACRAFLGALGEARPHLTPALGLILARSINVQRTVLAQTEYEIEHYGHLDFRVFDRLKTRVTANLWDADEELADEVDALWRAAEAGNARPDVEDCRVRALADLRSGRTSQARHVLSRLARRAVDPSSALSTLLDFAKAIDEDPPETGSVAWDAGRQPPWAVYVPARQVCTRTLSVLSSERQTISCKMRYAFEGQVHAHDQDLTFDPSLTHFIDDASLLNNHGTLIKDGQIVEETINCDPGRNTFGWPGIWASVDHRALIEERLAAAKIDRPVVLAANSRDPHSFAHWMLDVLPRIIIASQERETNDWPIMLTGDLVKWQREVLGLLHVDLDRIISIEGHVPADLAQVCFTATSAGLYPRPDSIRLLRQSFERSVQGFRRGAKRLLYVPRHAGFRRVLNEAQIDDAMSALGFETVSPGTMSVAEQIEVFSEADCVVAAGGAAVTNVLFMPPGSRLIVFGPATNYGTYFAFLAQLLGVRYAGAIGPPTPDLVHPYPGWDFSIDLGDLETAIEMC